MFAFVRLGLVYSVHAKWWLEECLKMTDLLLCRAGLETAVILVVLVVKTADGISLHSMIQSKYVSKCLLLLIKCVHCTVHKIEQKAAQI